MFSAQRGCFLVGKLYSSEVIIRHPVLNLVKWTHKLQSLNLGPTITFNTSLWEKVSRRWLVVPAAQIIQLAFFFSLFFFMSLFKLRKKNQKPGETVQFVTAAAAAQDPPWSLFMFSLLRYP